MNKPATLSTSNLDDGIKGSWRLDAGRSRVEFRTRSLWGMVAVKGHFDNFRGWMDLAADPAIELTIDAASLQTGNSKRDDHLRGPDFFDSEHHPQVRFVSDAVQLHGNTLSVRGRLCARGASIPLGVDAHVQASDAGLTLEATVTVPHRDLGMTWNWMGSISPHSRLHVIAYLTSE